MADCLTTTIEDVTEGCPHCGRQMPGQLEISLELNLAKANDRVVRLSPMQAEIMEAIRRIHPRPARVEYIAGAVGGLHGDDPSINCIQVTICQMRPKLAVIGAELIAVGNLAYELRMVSPLDNPFFTQDDDATIRRALAVLLKARKMIR